MYIASKLRNLPFKSTNLKWVCCYLGAFDSMSVWVCLKRTMISYFWHLSYSQLSIDEIRNWLLYSTLPLSLSLFSAIQNQIHSQSNSLILDPHSTWTKCHDVNEDYPPKLTTSNEFWAFECIHKTTYIDIILFNPFCLFLFVIWMEKSHETTTTTMENGKRICQQSTFEVIDMAFQLQLIYAFHLCEDWFGFLDHVAFLILFIVE